ncbi:MAG: helix-turn-helix domain-containing protein [Eubacteriales bacterium]
MLKKYELKDYARNSDLKSRSLSLYNYLVDRCDENNSCFPSTATMARDLHVGTSTIKRAMKELLEKDFVRREPRYSPKKSGGQTSNLYTVKIPSPKVTGVMQGKPPQTPLDCPDRVVSPTPIHHHTQQGKQPSEALIQTFTQVLK